MKFNILTLFPEMFPGPLNFSLHRKALKKKLFEIKTINIRDFSTNKSKTVDDKPFGGGPGMIMKADILQKSLEFVNKKKLKTFYLSPRGEKLNQATIKEIALNKEIILVCGRYEGIDERFLKYNDIKEISIGDYILSGGEIASFILIDACVRLIPEVLGNKESLASSFFVSGNFDLENLRTSFYEISGNEKLKNDDINFIEKEFNDLMFEDGYKSLFLFPKFKEFVKSITNETN